MKTLARNGLMQQKSLNHSFLMQPFSTPWKHQKTLRFSSVRRGRERVHWEQMVKVNKIIDIGWSHAGINTYVYCNLEVFLVLVGFYFVSATNSFYLSSNPIICSIENYFRKKILDNSSMVNEVIRTILFFLRESFISIKSINKRLSLKCSLWA